MKEKASNSLKNQNVYNEEDYVTLTQQIEDQISLIQELDKNFEEKLNQQIRMKGSECERKKE
jgi:hypothetical protein